MPVFGEDWEELEATPKEEFKKSAGGGGTQPADPSVGRIKPQAPGVPLTPSYFQPGTIHAHIHKILVGLTDETPGSLSGQTLSYTPQVEELVSNSLKRALDVFTARWDDSGPMRFTDTSDGTSYEIDLNGEIYKLKKGEGGNLSRDGAAVTNINNKDAVKHPAVAIMLMHL